MSSNKKVIWSEGLFIQPHHFQQQERYFENLLNQRMLNFGKYFWGFSKLKIDSNLLTLGKLGLVECSGVFPDGTVFDVPNNDEAPLHLDVPKGMHDVVVYLVIPLRREGYPEVGWKKNHEAYRYHISTIEVNDNNAEACLDAQLQVGEVALRLAFENEDRAGCVCLGVAKIRESRFDNSVALDEDFISPCIDITGSNLINKFMKELIDLLCYRGEVLSERIATTIHNATSEMFDFMLLQIVNRYEPYITHLLSLSGTHPAALYGLLVSLAGELAVFTNETRRPVSLVEYDHAKLQQTFFPLFTELRRSLSVVLEQNAIAIELVKRQYGIWVAQIADKSLFETSLFVLAVHADMPLDEIKTELPAQIKIAGIEHIRHLVTKALPGIDLQTLVIPPRQIPYHTKYTYFTLNNAHPYWSTLEKAGGLAFHLGKEFPGLKLELWAVRG